MFNLLQKNKTEYTFGNDEYTYNFTATSYITKVDSENNSTEPFKRFKTFIFNLHRLDEKKMEQLSDEEKSKVLTIFGKTTPKLTNNNIYVSTLFCIKDNKTYSISGWGVHAFIIDIFKENSFVIFHDFNDKPFSFSQKTKFTLII